GNNPVNIQNWVRNNVEWVPTWGAIQSAQDTLDKKRGNAIDIASLEIALLRAAKIPARYQFGTIELPAEQVMNWVGGVSKPEAAQQLLGQGGIANRGLIEGGKISKIRMEHAWVQAYVNWLPSRGAKQGSGTQHPSPQAQRNAWVPLDPSFKQYDNVQGAAVSANVPFNAAAAISATTQGAVLNEAEGWISGVNAAALTNVIDGYESALGAYINANEVHGSFGNVIGRKIIPFVQISLLSVTLPYSVIQLTSASPSVSPTLQHKFTYKLYASAYDKYEDVPFLEFSEKTTQLSGKRLSITYVPASQADADVINGYMPARHADGSGISPSEVPQSLPAYLIRLKAQLRVNGQVAAESSQIVSMGASLYSSGGFTRFDDISSWDLTSEDSNVAGQTTAIGLNMAGLSGAQVTELKDRMARTKAKLSSGDHAGLGVEEMAVDLLTTAIWSWFASADAHSRVVQKDGRMVEFSGLSYGLFHTIVNPLESWGVVRQAKFSGLNFDIGHVRYLGWSADNDKAGWVNFNKLRGRFMSALEHAVPERLFSDVASCNARGTTSPKPNLPACSEGISAVSAIAIAAKAGQKIFSINSTVYANNPGIVQQRLSAHSVETRAKIQAALDAGQEVLIHERPISKDGWVGAGYTVIDPETGAGGYLIEGGSNGAWWSGLFAGVSVGATIALIGLLVANALTGTGLALAAGLFGSVIVAVMAALILAIIINQILISYYTDDASASCFWGGFGLGNAAGGLVPGQSYVTAVINFIMAVVFSKGVSGDTYDSCSK
ncbi:MAG: transglutaminase domain-containing protein, partial [Burkholderiaceae bacterium]